MRVKTSITLSEDLLAEMDNLLGQAGNRSAFIEKALRNYIAAKNREIREAQDIEVLNHRAKILNEEAMDVLSYQADV